MKKSTTIRIVSILFVLIFTMACSTLTDLIDSGGQSDETAERSGIGEDQGGEEQKPSMQDEDQDKDIEKPSREKAPPDSEDAPEKPPKQEQQNVESPFPLTPDAQGIMESGGTIIYQTNLSVDEIIEFYRDALQNEGLSEIPLLTVIDESNFSIVFEGAPDGQVVVVQGVDFEDYINISIRYEDA